MTATKKITVTAENIVSVKILDGFDREIMLEVTYRNGKQVKNLECRTCTMSDDTRHAVNIWCRSHLKYRALLLATVQLRRGEMPIAAGIGGTEARLAVAFAQNYCERSKANDVVMASQAARDFKDAAPTRNVWDDEKQTHVFSAVLPNGETTDDFDAAMNAWAGVRETMYCDNGDGYATTYAYVA